MSIFFLVLNNFKSVIQKQEEINRLLAEIDENGYEIPTKPCASPKNIKPHQRNIYLIISEMKHMLNMLEKRYEEEIKVVNNSLGSESPSRRMRVSGTNMLENVVFPNQDQPTKSESNSLKGMLAKQEMEINEITLRLTEAENTIQKFDPNNLRALIKDIAELLLREGQKDVYAEMGTIKDTQKHYSQTAEMLKDELRIMDEKFKQDIENKIEKKELLYTKLQIRRKLNDLEQKLRGNEAQLSQNQPENPPLMLYNSKCFFCNQEVKCIFYLINHSIA